MIDFKTLQANVNNSGAVESIRARVTDIFAVKRFEFRNELKLGSGIIGLKHAAVELLKF